jgi:hypothetical protein
MKIRLTILLLIIASCSQNDRSHKNDALSINDSTFETAAKALPDSLSYDKEFTLNSYRQKLVDSLDKNVVPGFIYNECLDAENSGYTYIDSHHSISLRLDLLRKMSKEEIGKIIKLADSTILKKKCDINYSKELFYHEYSTWALLRMNLDQNR